MKNRLEPSSFSFNEMSNQQIIAWFREKEPDFTSQTNSTDLLNNLFKDFEPLKQQQLLKQLIDRMICHQLQLSSITYLIQEIPISQLIARLSQDEQRNYTNSYTTSQLAAPIREAYELTSMIPFIAQDKLDDFLAQITDRQINTIFSTAESYEIRGLFNTLPADSLDLFLQRLKSLNNDVVIKHIKEILVSEIKPARGVLQKNNISLNRLVKLMNFSLDVNTNSIVQYIFCYKGVTDLKMSSFEWFIMNNLHQSQTYPNIFSALINYLMCLPTTSYHRLIQKLEHHFVVKLANSPLCLDYINQHLLYQKQFEFFSALIQTLVEISSNKIQLYPDLQSPCSNLFALLQNLRDDNELTQEGCLTVLVALNHLIDDPNTYPAFLATAKEYNLTADGKLFAYMMLAGGYFLKAIGLTERGDSWIEQANEQLEQINAVEQVVLSSRRRIGLFDTKPANEAQNEEQDEEHYLKSSGSLS